MKKQENEKLILNKYTIYDTLIVFGTVLLIIALVLFITVFTGALTTGRASVIACVSFLIIGSIAFNVGRLMRRSAVCPEENYYEDYLTPAREARKAKKQDNKKAENKDK